ncbi:MAG: hypothetical protein AAB270_02120, partial [Chloroflexota bacterium]
LAHRHIKKPRRLVCSASGLHSLARVVTLPPLPPSAIPEAVAREAAREMPVAPQTTGLFWQPLGESQSGRRFFLLATPRNILDSLLDSLQEARAIPRKVELKPMALARLAGQTEAIFVDLEARSIDVTIVSGGLPILFRTVGWEGATEKGLWTVADEVCRTIDFFNISHPQEGLGADVPLFLTGPQARDAGGREQLASLIGHPLKPLSLPHHCPQGFDPGDYAANMGLALGMLSRRRPSTSTGVSINLLPSFLRPRRHVLRAALAAGGLLALVALAVPLYQVSATAALAKDRAQAQWYRVSQELVLGKRAVKEAARVEATAKELQSQAEGLEKE